MWEISDECERALDIYEGYPSLYVKEDVEVIVNDKPVKTMVYIMAKEYTNMVASPTEYYFNVIVRGYSDNALDLNPLQIAYEECLADLNNNKK